MLRQTYAASLEGGSASVPNVRGLLLVFPNVFFSACIGMLAFELAHGLLWLESRVRDPATRSSVGGGRSPSHPGSLMEPKSSGPRVPPLSTQRDGGFRIVFSSLSHVFPGHGSSEGRQSACGDTCSLDRAPPGRFSNHMWASAGISTAAPAKVACDRHHIQTVEYTSRNLPA